MADRSVVITGASSGIGAALALELSRRGGYTLALVARREAELAAVVAQCGSSAFAVVADVTERAAVERVAAEVIAAAGGFDVWVNNVGRGITKPALELTDADIDDMMRVNVKSALYGMQVAAAHDVYTRPGARQMILDYQRALGQDP